MAVSEALQHHENVEQVLYPGLKQHPGHNIAASQLRPGFFGGMISILVKGGREEAFRVTANLKLVTRATSLGGTETLIEHRESIENPPRSPHNLLRVSIGLEDAGDLIADFTQALSSMLVNY
jgi:cystathionine gamma-synthase